MEHKLTGDNMQKIVAIGDLHGHYEQLMQIFDKFMDNDWYGVDPNKDVFVFMGDYIDGGPDSKGILMELISLKEQFPHWKFLFGNHESLFLDGISKTKPIYGDYYLWYNQGGKATLESFKPAQSLVGLDEYERMQRAVMQPKDLITEEYTSFLRNLDLFYETDDFFFVHGGLYPNRSIKDHKKAVKKDYPVAFHPDLMREGDMAYDMIWMREPFIGSDYDWGKKIIFGHTTWPYGSFRGTDQKTQKLSSQPGCPFVMDNQIGIDTMMHNVGRITAVILPEGKFIQSEFTSDETWQLPP